MRFYELNEGRITLDGVDIAKMTREGLRSKTGMVLQDTWLFSGSIADNIAYGAPAATRDRSKTPPSPPMSTTSCARCPMATTRLSTRRGRLSVPGSASSSPSPAPFWRARHPHPGRGHQFGRHPHRTADPAGHEHTAPGPHQLCHRPPPFDHPRRRHDPRHGGGAHRRAGHAPPVARSRWPYSRLMRPSSPRPCPKWTEGRAGGR